jgi:hypothetical protein
MPFYRNTVYKPTREQVQKAKAAAERQRLKDEQAKRDEFVRSATLACLSGGYAAILAVETALVAQRELERKVPALFRLPKGGGYDGGYMPVAAYAGCAEPLAGAAPVKPTRKSKKTKTKE